MYIQLQDEISFVNCRFYLVSIYLKSSLNRSLLLSSLSDNEQIYFENSKFSKYYNQIGFELNTSLQLWISMPNIM